MKSWHYFIAVPVAAYALKLVLFMPAGWTNRLEVTVAAPVDFVYKYAMEHMPEIDAKYYPFNVHEDTKTISDDWVTPTHRKQVQRLHKTVGADAPWWMSLFPAALKPNPAWRREIDSYTEHRLNDVRLTSDNLALNIKMSFLEDAARAGFTTVRIDSVCSVAFVYKIPMWYGGMQVRGQTAMLEGIRTEVEKAYRSH